MRGTSSLIPARSHKTKICIHIHPIDCLIIPSICFILQKCAVVKDLNIDGPPPPPFLLLQDLQDSHDILNLTNSNALNLRMIFFQWMINIILHFKFQVPFRWKNVHMHRFFGIGYIYSQFKLLTSPQAPPDYRVWWVFLLDECFISICFFSNGRCQVVTTVTGPSNSSGFLSKEGYTIR